MSTLVEKILAKNGVIKGNLAVVNVNYIMSHDTTTPLAIEAFDNFKEKIIHRDKIVIVFDHIVPPSSPDAAFNQSKIKTFCRKYGLNFYEGQGICHTLMLEKGFAQPWSVIVGGDSHTPVYGVAGAVGLGMGSTDIAASWRTGQTWLEIPETIRVEVSGQMRRAVTSKDVALAYVEKLTLNGGQEKALEFCGDTLRQMDVFERMPIGVMATECTAVTQVFEDKGLTPDKNASYCNEVMIEANKLEPLIACPYSPDNVKAVVEVEGQDVTQVFIGSCTNGTIHDMRLVARIIQGRKISRYVRTIVAPATLEIYNQAIKEGLIEVLLESGAMICMPPGCGPCLGRHLGVLGDNDICLSTSNRNYQGRMGSSKAKVYLASPATAAATAIEGKIADPRRYL